MLIVLYRQNGKEIDQLLKDLCSKLDISYTYQKECNRIILEKGLLKSMDASMIQHIYMACDRIFIIPITSVLH